MSAMITSYQGERLAPENSGGKPRAATSPRAGSRFGGRLPARFHWLKRQLHPLIIHFPITFFLSATCFSLLYLLTRVNSFQDTARHCLGGGVLFTPLAIWTGFITTRINFPEPPPAARLEKILSFILLAAGLAALIWGLAMPDILDNLQGWNLLYLLLIISLTPLVTVISYFGGILTFPLE